MTTILFPEEDSLNLIKNHLEASMIHCAKDVWHQEILLPLHFWTDLQLIRDGSEKLWF